MTPVAPFTNMGNFNSSMDKKLHAQEKCEMKLVIHF